MPSLREYKRKRQFSSTPEPPARLRPVPATAKREFCVQQHRASRLHYDLRLEMGGVLKSWAVPKGPTLDPEVRRLAMETEDHPLDYLKFEGVIPEGNYGAGEVIVWDLGTYRIVGDEPPLRQYERGNIKFALSGKKLRGQFVLARMAAGGGADGASGARSKPWLLIKKHDDEAKFGDEASRHPGSVLSGLRVEQLAPALAEPAAGPPRAARRRKAQELPGAAPAPLPRAIHPMLATLAAEPFRSDAWTFEIKWDGVRALAFRRAGRLRLVSRSGRDITAVYPDLAALAKALPAALGDFLLDGEIVALDAAGRASFSRLQARINLTDTATIARTASRVPVVYYAFDVLHAGGSSLLRVPLAERKGWLRGRLATGAEVRYSDDLRGDGIGLFAEARARGLEGIVAKRLDSLYETKRSRCWLKIKVHLRQEAAIVGYTDPEGARDYFGALLLALYDPSRKRFYSVGRVGTGFDRATRRDLLRRMLALRRAPARMTGAAYGPGTHPVPPRLVAEVRFAEWTPEGKMRAPAFLGLRDDKQPRECRRESPVAAKVR